MLGIPAIALPRSDTDNLNKKNRSHKEVNKRSYIQEELDTVASKPVSTEGPKMSYISDVDEMIEMAEGLLVAKKKASEEYQTVFDANAGVIDEVFKLREPMQQVIKADLEALQKEYEKCGGGQSGVDSLDKLIKEEEQLKKECHTLEEKLNEISSYGRKLEEKGAELKQEMECLVEEKDRRLNETTVVLPLRMEEISLFNYVSGIKWDFEGLDENLEGYITNKTEVKTFSFSKETNSFDVTNSLWDLMNED